MSWIDRYKEGGRFAYLRLGFLIVFALGGAVGLGFAAPFILQRLYTALNGPGGYQGAESFTSISPFVVIGLFAGAFFGSLVVNTISRVGGRWDRMEMGDKVNIFLGVFAGLVASLPFLFLFNSLNINTAYVPFLVVGLTLGFASLSIYALQSMEEILPWTKNTTKQRRRGIKILDTNVIIDGRIYDVAKTGFLEGQLYVPEFVLEELQHIADDHDGLRRQRGRRGLEVLRHMQSEFSLEIGIHDRYAPDPREEVDMKIIRIAKALGADIVTNDWNLNRVASLQDLKVLNLNDLALAMKPNVLPSETLRLLISREGSQVGQGVGYLDDGTMVVVENGRSHLSETVEVTVTQVIQTERGKMIFGEVFEGGSGDGPPKKARRAH